MGGGSFGIQNPGYEMGGKAKIYAYHFFWSQLIGHKGYIIPTFVAL